MTDTTITIQVLHNAARDEHGRNLGMLNGYTSGDPLIHVADLQVPASRDYRQTLEHTYTVLNVGDDPDFGPVDSGALQYRARRNRSLSIGDVLVLDGVGFAVASDGFVKVPLAPSQVRRDLTLHGSTGIDSQPLP